MSAEKPVQCTLEEDKKVPSEVVKDHIRTQSQEPKHPVSAQSSLSNMIDYGSAETQAQPKSKQNQSPTKKSRVSNIKQGELRGAESFTVSRSLTVASLPKFSTVNNSLTSHEVKVNLAHIKETVYLWEGITRYAKRRLLILDGYIYCLEPENDGYFVVGVWDLNELTNIKLWPEERKVRLMFQDSKGKATKNRQFWVTSIIPFKEELHKQLLKMNRRIS